MSEAVFAIRNATVFTGTEVLQGQTVVVDGLTIAGLHPDPLERMDPAIESIDGTGCTLIPGLIDAHAHAKPGALAQAIAFGVTTELDMGSSPSWMDDQRALAASRDDVADVRSSSFGATVPDGHPSALIGTFFPDGFPTVSSPEQADGYVLDRIDEGADYIKFLIEEYAAWPRPAVPRMSPEISTAIVEAAHRRGLIAVAHVSAMDCAVQAVESGADGLVHLFMDRVATPEVVDLFAQRGVFVVPTAVTMGSIASDRTGARMADDPRIAGLIPLDWAENLRRCFPDNPHGHFDAVLQNITLLREGGVPLLVGTDTARVGTLGSAHGVSVHDEMRLFVEAGFSPIETLRAATSETARLFGLEDRGLIAVGRQADLVLIDGDVTRDIDHSLSIAGIWRRGARFDIAGHRVRVAESDATTTMT